MILLDFVGLFLSIVFLGPLYLFYIIFVAFIQEIVRILTILFLQGDICQVLVGGIFGNTFGILSGDGQYILVALSGPVICMLIGIMSGGLKRKQEKQFFNPFSRVSYPLGVIALRLGLLSTFLSIWQLL